MEEYFKVELSDSVTLALPLVDIEIIENFFSQKISSIPGIASFWIGVVNQKGSLLWVLDTNLFFELDSSNTISAQKFTAVVLNSCVEGKNRRVALVVKQLKGVFSVKNSHVEPIPTPLESQWQSYCKGVILQEEQCIYVLDTVAFFTSLRGDSN
ncbi:MAG: chemotaxis protein CheW [Prochloraceae cyanobacterium]|nr:chemotaxis protein CheW [Prochloraceae cyanobacterium]